MTQEKAAHSLGMTRTTYANYESSGPEPDFDSLLSISNFYGVSVDDILSRNLELENYLQGANGESRSANPLYAGEPHYDTNDIMISMLADRQETAIWYLLKAVREIREDMSQLKRTVKLNAK